MCQIYLDQARVGGEIHYLIERPSYPPETRYYYADLDDLGAVNNLTARDLYINFIGVVYLCIGLFVIFRQGGRAPFVLHFAGLCLAAFVFHFYTPIGTYRDLDPGDWFSAKCRVHRFRAAVSALQHDLSRPLSPLRRTTLAHCAHVSAGVCTVGIHGSDFPA